MTKTERFTSLDEVHAVKRAMRIERDARMDDLRVHWENVKDKEYRRALLLDAVSDLFQSKNGGGTLGAVAEGVKLAGGWLPIVAPLLAGRKGLLGSRLFWSGISLALPLLVSKDGASRIGELWDGVRNGIRQVKDFVRSHSAANADQE